MAGEFPTGIRTFTQPVPGEGDEHGLCTLSDLTVSGCHHCVTAAPNLGDTRELLGFDLDDDNTTTQEAA